MKNYDEIKRAISFGIPVFISYIPVAITFGLVAKNSGFSLFEAFAFSFFLITGSGQFMTINLWNINTGIVGIWFTVFLMNLRLFLMSSALNDKLTDRAKKYSLFIAPLITDESFALSSLQEKKIEPEFIIPLQCIGHFFWWTFTIIGYIMGGFLPENISNSMGIAIYALFISMLVPQMKKSLSITFIVLLSGFINWFIKYLNIFPSGWNIILAIIISSFVGSFILKEEVESNE
ncbi:MULTISPECIES: AzlC family ABC transporter permease [Fusobacterium]|uniref:AzlC family ABC transporter permease n=1 Tax=Fusobacterium TaxID=848 RepID=UPI001476A6A5|nr:MULTISPECIES: AzlC family ABC transporter permease [Fusobacterium]NME36827.1 hypothetical protein [Fusobacterium sp. FSA-380-WT-3A]